MSTEHTEAISPTADGALMLAPGTAIRLPDEALALADLPAKEVRSGSPRAGSREIDAGPGLDLGIWEMTTGTAVDIEVDECFIVLSGRATVTVQTGPGLGHPTGAVAGAEADASAGTPQVMELYPGTIGRLAAGMHTEWVVHESLRKVYLMPAGPTTETPAA